MTTILEIIGVRDGRFLIMKANDIRGWMGLSFLDTCLTVEGKPRRKPQPGQLTRPGIEPAPLCERQRRYPSTTTVVKFDN